MDVTTYPDAAAFLEQVQPALEASGPACGLLLGMCLRLARYPERFETEPCLVTVGDGREPVLAAAMIPPFPLVVHALRADPDAAARALAGSLPDAGRPVPGVQGPASAAAPLAARLAEATGRRARLARCEHLYELRAVRCPVPAGGRLRPATEADEALVAGWWYASNLAAFGRVDAEQSAGVARGCIAGGDVYVWDVGRPVSMAAVVAPPAPTVVTVGRVYTPPEERGHDYATACVAALSRRLLAGGHRACILFVEPSNLAARRTYERVGYRRLCEFHEIVLEE